MKYHRILTIQDISCVGQCSLTVALPILSAFGLEACVLPSAILSTHTSGFKGFTCYDFTEEIRKITSHWKNEKILFDAFYTGYLLNEKQIQIINDIFIKFGNINAKIIVDPVMGDKGKLYPGFDLKFIKAMKTLCSKADIIIPNLTEACLLTNYEYKEVYDENYIFNLIKKLEKLGPKLIILTGIGYTEDSTGVVVSEQGKFKYYNHRRIKKSYHGTGDIYSSVFVGAFINGINAFEAARLSADFIVECIENTIKDTSHWYGVKFEPLLIKLITKLKQLDITK